MLESNSTCLAVLACGNSLGETSRGDFSWWRHAVSEVDNEGARAPLLALGAIELVGEDTKYAVTRSRYLLVGDRLNVDQEENWAGVLGRGARD